MNNEVTIQFYPLDFDEIDNSIRIYGKTIDDKRIQILDNSIKPYFWVIPKIYSEKILDKIKNMKIKDEEETINILEANSFDKNYNDKSVKAIKVVVENQRFIKPVSNRILHSIKDVIVREQDINFIKRYLIEKSITPLSLCEVKGLLISDSELIIEGNVKQVSDDLIEKLNILAFDIEVYGYAGGDDKIKKDPIISVAFSDNNGLNKVVTWKRFPAPKYVEFVDSEEALINKFIEVLEERQPDLIVGYYSDGFDFPYLRGRAEKYKINLNLGINKNKISFRRGRQSSSVRIEGIPHLDIFKFIKNIMAGSLKLDSYSLESVAQELLKEGKYEIEKDLIEESWDKGDIHELCQYNLQDANLTLKICEKILPNINELVKLIGIGPYEISRMHYGQLVENYLIRRAKDFDEIVPNKPSQYIISDRITSTYQGAFVMEPKPGLYEDIVFLDFMSLYPTIIITKNISPSMLNKNKGYKTPKILDENGSFKQYMFNYEKEAFIPSVVKDLVLRRNRIKEIIKNEEEPNQILRARSYALKTVANSTYGYMGFFGARWYCKECAASITAWARDYIKKVIKEASKEFQVIYSDTDSIAFTLDNKNIKDALNFLERINKELPSLMELELESFYPRGIFVSKKSEGRGAKKKYALIDRKDKIKITGFETIRGDWSLIAKETQFKILELILRDKDVKKAREYVQGIIESIKNKEIGIKKMLIKTQLRLKVDDYKQIGPHVAIAKRLKELGINLSQGTNIHYVIVEGEGMIRDRAKLLSECKQSDYDSKYYIENQIIPSVEKIFEIFDIKKEDLINREQSKLGDF